MSLSTTLAHAAKALVEAGKHGMGMFVESYFLFAIGNVQAIWEVQYPWCFNEGKDPVNSGLSAFNYTDSCPDLVITSMSCKSTSHYVSACSPC